MCLYLWCVSTVCVCHCHVCVCVCVVCVYIYIQYCVSVCVWVNTCLIYICVYNGEPYRIPCAEVLEEKSLKTSYIFCIRSGERRRFKLCSNILQDNFKSYNNLR